jgi:hypothetical protein
LNVEEEKKGKELLQILGETLMSCVRGFSERMMGRAQGAMKCMSRKATDGPAAKGRRRSESRRSSSSSRACHGSRYVIG